MWCGAWDGVLHKQWRQVRKMRMWALLIVLLAALGGLSAWLAAPPLPKHERVDLNQQLPPSAGKVADATLEPGRVVSLSTNTGTIDFVLFEEDCPNTTSRIVSLVEEGCYDGVKFERVEEGALIQNALCKKKVKGIDTEVRKRLTHAKGAVGMARIGRDYKSNTSVFYILMEPAPSLDLEYTVFGRVISGMDVVMKIRVGDTIRRATGRELTEADRKRFHEVLTIESDRRTQ